MPGVTFVAVDGWSEFRACGLSAGCPEVPAPAPPKPARKKPGPKPRPPRPARKPARSAGKRPLSVSLRTVLADAIEDAIESGRIELCPDELPCAGLDLTRAELAMLARILFPAEQLQAVEELGAMLKRRERAAAVEGNGSRRCC